jgi:hypothetical protein
MDGNITIGERSIDQQPGIDDVAIEEREPVCVAFKTGDEPEFQKPDHDPHGETFAAVTHSWASCDNGCGTSGLVPTGLLEDADGLTGWPPFDIYCVPCAEAFEREGSR